jgi:LysM repeat protein
MKITLLRSKSVLVTVLVLVLLLAAVAPTFASNEPEAPTQSGYYHLISYGETLSRIAFAYGVPIQAILDANPQIADPNLIYYGTYIFIPHSINQPYTYPPYGCRVDYVVKTGDTVFSIGREYEVSPYDIAYANYLYNWNYIYVGQYLCIP